MYLYNKNKILLECLDYHRHETEYRIKVKAWKNLTLIREQFFTKPYSLMYVFNYLREIGLVEVIHKILSRVREKNRNYKFLACGIGEIVEAPAEQEMFVGKNAFFIATNHPSVPERIVVPKELMSVSDISLNLKEMEYFFADNHENIIKCNYADIPGFWGWNLHSGYDLNNYSEQIHSIFQQMKQINWNEINRYTKAAVSGIKEMNYHIEVSNQLNKGVIFGLGNYAKTNIIPKIEKYINLLTIHEIDPTQIHKTYMNKYNVDTCELLRNDEKYDAYFIAGYHHMHNQISIQAIKNNAYAVVEKPVVTNKAQLKDLLATLRNCNGKLISCFQKRYSPLNHYIFKDLHCETNKSPISYHCIVYEVKLPKFHWYTWPNSESRLISNGCHWIDHFFYLNKYCNYVATEVYVSKNSKINCTIELENGAIFTMTLFDEGSNRIGMQEYVWLTSGNSTVKILNSSKYYSENNKKVVRKIRINKTEAYRKMYQKIAEIITENKMGDEIYTIDILWNAILELESKYQKIVQDRSYGILKE